MKNIKNAQVSEIPTTTHLKRAAAILLLLCLVMSFMAVMRTEATPATPATTLIMSDTFAPDAPNEPNPFDPDTVISSVMFVSGFPQIMQISIDPAIALSILSVVGLIHNEGWLDLGNSGFVNTASALPTANLVMVILLILFALTRSGLDLTRVSSLLDEAFLERANQIIGIIVVVVMNFSHFYASDSAAVEFATMSANNNEFSSVIILTFLGFVSSGFSLVTFGLVRSLMSGVNAAIFIFGLIPGTFQILKVCKVSLILFYALLCAFFAPVAVVIGIIILVAAILLFRIMRRLECYYKQIYVKPFVNSVYKWAFKKNTRENDFPMVIKRLPKYVRETFPDMKICQEAFILRGIPNIAARERAYLVHDNAGETHICWRKWYYFGWNTVGLNMEALYGDPQFRFLMLYSVEEHVLNKKGEPDDKKTFKRARVKIVLRRELNEQFDYLMMMLRFYESPLNVARRKKAMEKECKREQKRLLKAGAVY